MIGCIDDASPVNEFPNLFQEQFKTLSFFAKPLMEGRRIVKAPRKQASETQSKDETMGEQDPLVTLIENALSSVDFSQPLQQSVFNTIIGVVQQAANKPPEVTSSIALKLTLFLKQLADHSFLEIVDGISIFIGALVEFGAEPVSEMLDTWIELMRICLNKATEKKEEDDDAEELDLDRFEKATAAVFSRSSVGRLKLKQNEDIVQKAIQLRWKWRFIHHITVTMGKSLISFQNVLAKPKNLDQMRRN